MCYTKREPSKQNTKHTTEGKNMKTTNTMREANLRLLKILLEKKDWEYHEDENGELSFIFGNLEPSTADMDDEFVASLMYAVATR